MTCTPCVSSDYVGASTFDSFENNTVLDLKSLPVVAVVTAARTNTTARGTMVMVKVSYIIWYVSMKLVNNSKGIEQIVYYRSHSY